MKKIVSCVLLLSFLIATVYSQATPSLEDTLAWLKRYIELYGVYMDDHIAAPVTFLFKPGSNQITLIGNRYDDQFEYTTTFQLNDLDPEALDISEDTNSAFIKTGYFQLSYRSNEKKDLIKVLIKVLQGSTKGHSEIFYRYFGAIDFKDKSIAERVAAAFKNAILKAKEKEIF